ncbi:hypothetical protein MKZ38_000667 [Zalerion maritima]|uniref:Uncharacterized protein n=1 Tax=Zalerion maritima TaxID=339359 RepID=A0AAD5RZ37_9PEZI|nr:hypothetical protein MKZ38_000667 [Zalerion maritima]
MEGHSTAKPISGAERIRALTDTDEKFKAFDSYPWTKDQTFLFGLKSILGPPPTSGASRPSSPTSTTTQQPLSSPVDISIRARLFYYSQRIGADLSFDDYKLWLSRHPEHQPPDILPEEYKTVHTGNPLPWQSAAPKGPLWVDKSKANSNASSTAGDGNGGEKGGSQDDKNAPYPSSFTAIVELIASGKPVPGIRDIPNTIIHDPKVTPFGKMTRPRKPWEKTAPRTPEKSSGASSKQPTNVDHSFPILNQAGASPSS